MSETTFTSRDQIPVEYTWNLGDIFADDDKFLEELEALKEFPEKVAAFQGKLDKSAEDLLAWYQLNDELDVRISSLYGYASMKSDEDTSNAFYLDLKGKAMNVYVQIMSAGAFADSEIMAIPEETLAAWYEACPSLKTYRRPIEKIRKEAAHILSPAEETILAAASELKEASENTAGALRNADMSWDDVMDKDAVPHTLTNGTFVPLEESTDRILRENAFHAFYAGYEKLKNTIAATLDGQFKQLVFFSRTRKYPSTLDAALASTEVPKEVYLNLIEAVHQNLDKMYRYVRLRKKLLGLSELHMYDVYTPIAADTAMTVSFEDAKNTVLTALSVLGEDYTGLLKQGFENRWIDVYENKGKRGGAYSSGSSRPHPYVLLNHKDNLDSVFTLAHEMGHALHSWHSTKNQPVCTSDYVIFVAEVASTVNEVLLNHYLLEHAQDKKERAYIINHFLEGFKGTVFRQTMFAEFELIMGRMAEEAQTLTAEALSEKYLELNQLYFGPDMISDREISFEWARIPHFFYNYYVFQYATGYSAAVAIANRILKEGKSAVKEYKAFLSAGSSQDPISVLKIAGVDMSTPGPVNEALAYFGELVEEMEKIAE